MSCTAIESRSSTFDKSTEVTQVTRPPAVEMYFAAVRKWFPILDWLPHYGRVEFLGDLPAGLTVGVMLIPQGMAYAMIAGLPVVYGLYASIVPLIVYAVMGTSKQLAVGPVAMDSLLVASGLLGLAAAGTGRYIELALLLAFMTGVLQLTLGLLRMGFLANFLSHPVIAGFITASGILIAVSQLKQEQT